jgi:hypothetical protein
LLRALTLVVLLAAGGFVAPSASAQAPVPVLCFDHDPPPPLPNAPNPNPGVPQAPGPPNPPNPKYCPGGVPDVPNYLEGTPVNISIRNLPPGVQVTLKVTCFHQPPGSDCHELQNQFYYAVIDSSKWWAWFPREFDAPPGGNAEADHAGRYNATWTASANVQGQDLSRNFDMWMIDAYKAPNATLVPGATHVFHAAGFEPNTPVQFTVQRLIDDNDHYVPVRLDPPPPATADLDGLYFYSWSLPLDESTRSGQCPPDKVAICYQVVVRGTNTTKAEEAVDFEVGAATQIVQVLDAPASQPAPIERTENATLDLLLNYPGGDRTLGPTLLPADLPPGPDNSTPLPLRVLVMRANLTGTLQVGEVPLRYDSQRFLWTTTWTVPRDLDLPVGANWTLRLADASDRWGNRIAAEDLATYSVGKAMLTPEIVSNFTTLGRTELGTMSLSIRYHDGEVLDDADNNSTLQGCFVNDTGTGHNACNPTNLTTGTFRDDLWNFTVRYARDDPNLGAYLFIFDGGATTTDKWGNQINGVQSSDYQLVADSQHVDFETVMRGRATDTLERGEHVSLSAVVTYGDGSPFNHTVRADPNGYWASILNVTVTKRGPDGAVQATQVVGLDEIDTETGLWQGAMDLTPDVQDTPAGRWTFDLLVNDTVGPPNNENRTSFDRTIIPEPIRFEPLRTTPLVPEAGTGHVLLDFKLYYPAAYGQQPVPVSPDAIRSTLIGQVYRWDAQNRTITGDSVSGPIQPTYSTDRGAWTLDYAVPGNLFNGSYVIQVRGTDTSGNPVQEDAFSQPFRPHSPVHDRQILTEPQPSLERGDAATILVAAQDGDSGPDGTGNATISVERWDADSATWQPVPGGEDVTQPSDLNGHFGVFPITTTTPTGLYHFVFLGREAPPTLALVTNTSTNFTVEPTTVTRGILTQPPAVATKGDFIQFAIERQEGDRIDAVQLQLNGRGIDLPHPILIVGGDRFNVTWRIPFEAPNGNYTIHIEGHDVYGNDIVIDAPAIETLPAQLAGKIIGDVSPVVERGTPATLIFGVAYPSGAFYTAGDALPTVVVHNATDIVATAAVTHSGAAYVASWTPPAPAPIADYWFEVTGQGLGGNAFPSLASSKFRLAPGTFQRDPATAIPVGEDRMADITFGVPIDPADKDVSFQIGYFGFTGDTQHTEDQTPLTLTPLPHTINNESGRYEVRFVTDQDTPVGTYIIYMKGEDQLGNAIASKSNAFILRQTTIIITFDLQPPNDAFAEGKTFSLSFVARYKSGALMDDSHGHPSVALLLNDLPTTTRPDVQYANGHWIASVQIPPLLRDGQYVFAVGGNDVSGNLIATARSIPYVVSTGIANSFAKVVPGPEPVLGILAIAAAALVLGGLRRRR